MVGSHQSANSRGHMKWLDFLFILKALLQLRFDQLDTDVRETGGKDDSKIILSNWKDEESTEMGNTLSRKKSREEVQKFGF